MNRVPRTPFVLVIACALAACSGTEVGRVPLTGEGAGETIADLKAGQVDFWMDIHLEYDGDAALQYRVDLLQDGVAVATTTCNPLGAIHVKGDHWTATNVGDKHTRRGSGKMSCSLDLARGGRTTVKTALAFSKRPATLTFDKADLVVRQ